MEIKCCKMGGKSSSSHIPNLLQVNAKTGEFRAELRAWGDSPAGSQARSSRGSKPPASWTSIPSSRLVAMMLGAWWDRLELPASLHSLRVAARTGQAAALPEGSLLPGSQAVHPALTGFPSLPLLLLQPDFYLLSSLFRFLLQFHPGHVSSVLRQTQITQLSTTDYHFPAFYVAAQ